MHAHAVDALCGACGMCRNLRKRPQLLRNDSVLVVGQSMFHRQEGEVLNVGVEADSFVMLDTIKPPTDTFLFRPTRTFVHALLDQSKWDEGSVILHTTAIIFILTSL